MNRILRIDINIRGCLKIDLKLLSEINWLKKCIFILRYSLFIYKI